MSSVVAAIKLFTLSAKVALTTYDLNFSQYSHTMHAFNYLLGYKLKDSLAFINLAQ